MWTEMARSRRQRQTRSQRPRVQSSGSSAAGTREAGEKLAELRQHLGLTQVQLAERLTASQRAVSHVEHEPTPRVATIAAYVQALGGRLELRAVFADRAVALKLTDEQQTTR
jgi:DNA-binding XRE family transcriptional regulator